jgi:hypothetical protein
MYDCVLDLYFCLCIHAKSVYVKFVDLTSDDNTIAAVVILYHQRLMCRE